MTRFIRLTEPRSGLSARCHLLDDKAPRSAELLWRLAQNRSTYDAIHAMWTGPELSCPLASDALPAEMAKTAIPLENATSYPKAGELALTCISAGSIKGLPPGVFFDLGVFYGDGGRLLFPFGWLMANICAEIVADDLLYAKTSLEKIRNNGACKLTIGPV
ncbi:MAG: DUF3830 family protein [Woeseia sp.]